MKNEILVEAVELTREFGRGRVALRDVSLAIERGEYVAISGPSGCGKTTLLSLLGALDRPTRGRVIFDGQELVKLSYAARARVRRRTGLVFQHPHMIARLPLWENISYPLVPLGASAAERKKTALRWLARVGLADRVNCRPEELSGGERGRVGVARALAHEPELILADEPLSDLDAESAGWVGALFEEFRARGGTLVVATHAPAEEAASARQCRLVDGRLVS